jgi:predicted ferric reductase
MNPRLLIALYLGVVLLPLGLAAIGTRPPRSVADELASGLGMVAFAIILVEFTLSGRFRTISGRIGMDVTMRIHQLVARTALAAAVLHPFLYRAAWNPPYPWDATRLETLTTDLGALWSGILAWVLLPAFVVLAIARGRPNYGYETWRLMHGLGAVAIAALVLHHTLSAGRYAADPALAALWIALSLVALATVLWVYVVVPLGQVRRPWRIWEVEISPQGHSGLAYQAGQFVWLNIGHTPFGPWENPFSISSAPSEGRNLRFLVKELGDFTRSLGSVAPGTRAHLDGPHGTLTVQGHEAPGIGLVAGGIGIAPLIGILRELALREDPRPRVLVYADRRPEQIVHRDELERLAAAAQTELVLVFEEPPRGWAGESGRVDAALLARLFGTEERRRWLYVLCGPPPMLTAVEDTLVALGVPPRNVLSERFDYD